MVYGSRRRTYRKRYTRKRASYTRLHKRNSFTATRALRIAKSISRKVAGEVNKWQVIPSDFSNAALTTNGSTGSAIRFTATKQSPLNTITSGDPWIMPLNWVYTGYSASNVSGVTVDGVTYSTTQNSELPSTITTISQKNPLWYNALDSTVDTADFVGAELQYKLSYIYIRAIFNASVASSQNNTDGAVRFVIVKDKQPQGGAATWYDNTAASSAGSGSLSNVTSRGVFSGNRIDAQLNPATVGRFKIMYDKTLRFTTTNGYKPFKYFKRLNTVVRNTRRPVQWNNSTSSPSGQTNSQPPPVARNAFYLMIFSDGPTFTFSTASSTPAAGFHLYSRVGYYNN